MVSIWCVKVESHGLKTWRCPFIVDFFHHNCILTACHRRLQARGVHDVSGQARERAGGPIRVHAQRGRGREGLCTALRGATSVRLQDFDHY
jgi:hypothetical protein